MTVHCILQDIDNTELTHSAKVVNDAIPASLNNDELGVIVKLNQNVTTSINSSNYNNTIGEETQITLTPDIEELINPETSENKTIEGAPSELAQQVEENPDEDSEPTGIAGILTGFLGSILTVSLNLAK